MTFSEIIDLLRLLCDVITLVYLVNKENNRPNPSKV